MYPKVSVIIPVYNCEKTIIKALDSVLCQNIDSQEIICIDDGSTDNSFDVLASYSKKFNNIIVVKQENQGAGPARNNGMQIAKGEFIAFLDGDDWYPSNDILKRLYDLAKKNNVLVCGGSLEVYQENKLVKKKGKGFEGIYFKKEGILDYVDYQFDYFYQRFIYSRKMLLENSIVFPNFRRFQDPPFFVEAMITAKKFYAIVEPTYCYNETYKAPMWDAIKIKDFLAGLKYLLRISDSNSLEILHRLTLFRIENSLIWRLKGNYSYVDDAIYDYIDSLNIAVNRRLINIDDDYIIKPLRILNKVREFDCKIYHTNYAADCICRRDLDFIPKISVIVPVYNDEQYVNDCLESLINQTLKEIEIICVDDGSKDNSLEVLKEFASKDARIRVYSQKNSGLSVSRNVGISVAEGEYIDCLDSDDYLDSEALLLLYKKAKQCDLDMVLYNAIPFGDGSCKDDEKRYATYYNRIGEYNSIYRGIELMDLMLSNGDYLSSGCLYIFSNQLQKKNGLKYIDGILHEDNAFTFEILLSAEKVGYLPNKFYFRRVRENSIMTKKKTFYNAYGYFKCYRHMEKFALDKFECGYFSDFNTSIFTPIINCLNWAINIYKELDDSERVCVEALNKVERTLFNEYVIKKSMLDSYQNKVETLQKEKKVLYKNLNNIKGGYSFRIGRVMTWLPRMITGALKCFNEHGFKYTLKRALWHIGFK